MKYIFLLTFFFISFTAPYREKVAFDYGIYKGEYSEVYEQPLWIQYSLYKPVSLVSRGHLNFYKPKDIHTSDNSDYANNEYDKGHIASAESFSDTKDHMYTTFSYCNSALQNFSLNRGIWKELESKERSWAQTDSIVVKCELIFSKSSIKLKSGATVPDSFRKTIYFVFSKKQYIYYFNNSAPTKPLESYLISQK